MKWITREHPRVDRVACPWLIEKFVDKQAEFLYVPSDQVAAEAQKRGATPYDIKEVELGHHGPECSFDAFVHKYGLAPWIMRYRKHPAVQGFTKGATAAAAGAIVGAAGVIATQVLTDAATVIIFIVALVVPWRFKVPEPALVGISALAGLALFGLR